MHRTESGPAAAAGADCLRHGSEELKKLKAELGRRAAAEAIATERERTIETQATALKVADAAPVPVEQLERLAAERDEATANARWGCRPRLRKPETGN